MLKTTLIAKEIERHGIFMKLYKNSDLWCSICTMPFKHGDDICQIDVEKIYSAFEPSFDGSVTVSSHVDCLHKEVSH